MIYQINFYVIKSCRGSNVKLLFSVILFANHTALTGIAIFLNIMCIKMVREDKSSPPPRLFKFVFNEKISKILCLSGYEVIITFNSL